MTITLPSSFFFFNDTATTEIYTLSLHDALPISHRRIARLGSGLQQSFWSSDGADGLVGTGVSVRAQQLFPRFRFLHASRNRSAAAAQLFPACGHLHSHLCPSPLHSRRTSCRWPCSGLAALFVH